MTEPSEVRVPFVNGRMTSPFGWHYAEMTPVPMHQPSNRTELPPCSFTGKHALSLSPVSFCNGTELNLQPGVEVADFRPSSAAASGRLVSRAVPCGREAELAAALEYRLWTASGGRRENPDDSTAAQEAARAGPLLERHRQAVQQALCGAAGRPLHTGATPGAGEEAGPVARHLRTLRANLRLTAKGGGSEARPPGPT